MALVAPTSQILNSTLPGSSLEFPSPGGQILPRLVVRPLKGLGSPHHSNKMLRGWPQEELSINMTVLCRSSHCCVTLTPEPLLPPSSQALILHKRTPTPCESVSAEDAQAPNALRIEVSILTSFEKKVKRLFFASFIQY